MQHNAGHEAGEEHVEVYCEAMAADGTLIYALPAGGAVTPSTLTSLNRHPILEPYPALEVRLSAVHKAS